jgi:hypothetical protein
MTVACSENKKRKINLIMLKFSLMLYVHGPTAKPNVATNHTNL